MTRILGLITASILMAGLLGAPKTAQAETGDMGIDLNLFSYHLERCFSNCTREFNEVNAGLTYTYQAHDHAEVMVGFLTNSFNATSKFLAVNFITRGYSFRGVTFTPAFALGGIDGYEDTPVDFNYKGVAPVLMPNLTVQRKIFRFNLGVLPSADTAVFTFRTGIVF